MTHSYDEGYSDGFDTGYSRGYKTALEVVEMRIARIFNQDTPKTDLLARINAEFQTIKAEANE